MHSFFSSVIASLRPQPALTEERVSQCDVCLPRYVSRQGLALVHDTLRSDVTPLYNRYVLCL
jgi:hypothetical protein